MKYMYIFLLLICFVSCQNNEKVKELKLINNISEQNDINSNITLLEREFGASVIYKAMDHLYPDLVPLSKSSNYIEYEEYVDSIISKKILSTFSSFDSNISYNKDIIPNLRIWCETYVIITIPVNMKEVISLEEIVYNIPETKFIVESFLVTKEQDWGSLSTSQIYELPYLVCNHITNLDEQARIDFYKDYFKTINNLIQDF